MKIEFLILVKKDDSFCDSEQSFISFLKADSKIEIDNNKIKYLPNSKSEKLHVDYSLSSGEVENKDERYFLLELIRADESRGEEFTELSRILKKIIERINPNNVKINTLWDDLTFQNAAEAYPIISKVENLMRKLISKFMLINVGMNWSKSAIHSEISNKMENKSNLNDVHFDDIYKTDFIHLSDILFKKYRELDLNGIDKLIEKAKTIKDIKLTDLKKTLPYSNWERFFFKNNNYE